MCSARLIRQLLVNLSASDEIRDLARPGLTTTSIRNRYQPSGLINAYLRCKYRFQFFLKDFSGWVTRQGLVPEFELHRHLERGEFGSAERA
jgi:hypothetical protein